LFPEKAELAQGFEGEQKSATPARRCGLSIFRREFKGNLILLEKFEIQKFRIQKRTSNPA
jgi:hypothetical protein